MRDAPLTLVSPGRGRDSRGQTRRLIKLLQAQIDRLGADVD